MIHSREPLLVLYNLMLHYYFTGGGGHVAQLVFFLSYQHIYKNKTTEKIYIFTFNKHVYTSINGTMLLLSFRPQVNLGGTNNFLFLDEGPDTQC